MEPARRALQFGVRTPHKHIYIGRILHDLGRFEEATRLDMVVTRIGIFRRNDNNV
jgi:hypothetical protein